MKLLTIIFGTISKSISSAFADIEPSKTGTTAQGGDMQSYALPKKNEVISLPPTQGHSAPPM